MVKPLGKDAATERLLPVRGGARKNAGRPDSAAKGKSLKVANDIAAGKRFVEEHDGEPLPRDATPLDVMLMAMRKAYELYGSLRASEYAEKCAPYLHAKIASIELKGNDTAPLRTVFMWAGQPPSDTSGIAQTPPEALNGSD